MKATEGDGIWVWWVDGDIVKDQDFAGDITLFDSRPTWRGVIEQTCELHEETANVGFIINPAKTNIKKMRK